jgi:hypothetical protein
MLMSRMGEPREYPWHSVAFDLLQRQMPVLQTFDGKPAVAQPAFTINQVPIPPDAGDLLKLHLKIGLLLRLRSYSTFFGFYRAPTPRQAQTIRRVPSPFALVAAPAIQRRGDPPDVLSPRVQVQRNRRLHTFLPAWHMVQQIKFDHDKCRCDEEGNARVLRQRSLVFSPPSGAVRSGFNG